jgi:hypothetical protein
MVRYLCIVTALNNFQASIFYGLFFKVAPGFTLTKRCIDKALFVLNQCIILINDWYIRGITLGQLI